MRAASLALLLLVGLAWAMPPAGAAHVVPAKVLGVAPSVSSGNSVSSYNTTDGSDITQVAVSPDGSYVAAASDDRNVYVFGAITPPSGPWTNPIAILQLPAGSNVTSLAVSDTTAVTGAPLLFVTYASSAGSTGLEAWNITGSTMFSGSPAWKLVPQDFSLPANAKPWIRQVAIANDGSAAIVMTSYSLTGQPGINVSYYQSGSQLLKWKYGENFSNYWPVSLSMATDGSRAVAAAMISDATPVLLVFATNGYQGQWVPPTGAGAGRMSQGVISGNGQLMYIVATTGVYIGDAVTLTANYTIGVTTLPTVTQLSPSYTGDQILCSGGSGSFYFNWSQAHSWTPAVWSVSFPSSVQNGTIAPALPNYFAVSSQTTVSFFYLYNGMPESTTSSYRQVSTTGPLDDLAISATMGTLGIGSGHLANKGQEFTLVSDVGIPAPATPGLQMTPVSPSPGDGSASFYFAWTETTVGIPITQVQLTFALTPGSSSGSIPAPPSINVTKLGAGGSGSVTVGGFSFSTNYTATLVLRAYGGASASPSISAERTTDGPPAVQDPFLVEEVAAIALLVVGLVAFYLIAVRGSSPKRSKGGNETPSSPAPSPMSYPPQNLPPAGGPGGP